MSLQVIERAGTFVHVALHGRLDLLEVQAVELKFLGFTASSGKPTIVDLSKVDFIGSIGLGMLAGAAKSLLSHGSRLVVVNPQPGVEKVMRAASLDMVIPIAHSLEEAKALCGLR